MIMCIKNIFHTIIRLCKKLGGRCYIWLLNKITVGLRKSEQTAKPTIDCIKLISILISTPHKTPSDGAITNTSFIETPQSWTDFLSVAYFWLWKPTPYNTGSLREATLIIRSKTFGRNLLMLRLYVNSWCQLFVFD